MLYYLSLLTHTDQLAFFRLFKYLTFRSGGAVMTALLIAFLINPMLIRWLKVKQGKGQPIRSDGPPAPHRGEGGHADHGRAADPDPLGGLDLVVGQPLQPLCLDRAAGDGALMACSVSWTTIIRSPSAPPMGCPAARAC